MKPGSPSLNETLDHSPRHKAPQRATPKIPEHLDAKNPYNQLYRKNHSSPRPIKGINQKPKTHELKIHIPNTINQYINDKPEPGIGPACETGKKHSDRLFSRRNALLHFSLI
jgi:hypothetical protein